MHVALEATNQQVWVSNSARGEAEPSQAVILYLDRVSPSSFTSSFLLFFFTPFVNLVTIIIRTTWAFAQVAKS